jgi:hypothetical protein
MKTFRCGSYPPEDCPTHVSAIRGQGYTGDPGLQSLRLHIRFRRSSEPAAGLLSMVATEMLGSDWRYFRSIKFRALGVP